MIRAVDILNDNGIIEMYSEIDKQNKVPFNHGMKHVKNVYNIMQKLCDALDIQDLEREALLISVALHDVGQVTGRDNHGYRSMQFAREYLKEYESELGEYYELILKSIENHSAKGSLDDFPLFAEMLRFVDKMDFTRDRLIDNYRESFDYFISEDVLSVDFECNSDDFVVRITTNDGIDEQLLLKDDKFFPKVVNAIIQFASKLGTKYTVFINKIDVTDICNQIQNGRKK